MTNPAPLGEVETLPSSYIILALFAALGVAAGLLLRLGLIGRALHALGLVVRGSVRQGFLLWRLLFGWAAWRAFLGLALALLVAGWAANGRLPSFTACAGLAALVMGLTACLAY